MTRRLRWKLWLLGPGATQQRARRILFAGWAVRCPCCEKRARRFIADYNRARAKCPNCFSEERQRALRLFLEEWLGIPTEPAYLLHQAPDSPLRPWLESRPGYAYIAADLAAPHVALRYDLQRIPFRSSSFDVIIASHVLEHIDDDRAALAEILRTLKPGGSLVAMVPIDASRSDTYEDPTVTTPDERAVSYWQSDHVRLYGRDFPSRLAEAGFSVTMVQPSERLSPAMVRRFGLSVDPNVYKRVPIAPPDEVYVATRTANTRADADKLPLRS